MNHQKLENIIRASRLEPIGKLTYKNGEIYIAKGYHNACSEYAEPHWCYLWAAAAGEDKISMAQKMIFKFGEGTEESRLQAVIDEAAGFIETTTKQIKQKLGTN